MPLSNSLTHAAVVMNSMSTDCAAQVLSRLEAEDIKCVLAAILQIKKMTPLVVRGSIDRFTSEAEAEINRRNKLASLVSTNPVFRGTDDVSCRSGNTTFVSELPFSFFETISHETRLRLLKDEHPKNIALVLSCVKPQTASELVSSLDSVLRVSVVKRICELEELDPKEIADLCFEIKSRLNKLSGLGKELPVGFDVASRVLSGVDETVQYTLLEEIDQADPDMARFLKESVLVFEDLQKLDSDDLTLVLSKLDTSIWAPVLKNASSSLQVRVFDVLAEKPAELLAKEMEQMEFVDHTAQQAARKTVTQAMLDLSLSGRIEFAKQLAG